MARMKKLLPLLGIVLVAVIVFALFQMGVWPFGGAGSDTTDTTAYVAKSSTTSSASAKTSASSQVSAADQGAEYTTAMHGWIQKYGGTTDTQAFVFKKVTTPTAQEKERAQAAVVGQTESMTALGLIVAPEAIAAVHAQYAAAVDSEVRAARRLIAAIENKNRRDIELALRDIDAAHALGDTAMEGLDQYMAAYDQAETSSSAG